MPRGTTRAGSRPGYGPGFFLLMEDGSHAQIMFCRTKDIFHFRKLDVGIPQDFRIGFIPVGAQDIAAAHVPSPCITFLVLVYADNKAVVVLGNRNEKQRDAVAVSFKKTAHLPFYFLFIPDLSVLCLFSQLHELLFQPVDKAIEDGVFFFLASHRAAEHKGLISTFRGRTQPDLYTGAASSQSFSTSCLSNFLGGASGCPPGTWPRIFL
jgi:hypothetical protein